MNKAKDLKLALYALFRSGADEDHDAEELAELLEDIDFHALLQGLRNEQTVVYQYHADGDIVEDFEYYGPVLFPAGAVRLYMEVTDSTHESALCRRALELWLLPDMNFAVTSLFHVVFDGGAYETEYRTFKGFDWRDAGMDIDFLQLADDLEDMCVGPCAGELPVFEL